MTRTKQSLTEKLLREATPRQILRARVIIGRNMGVYGWSNAEGQISKAIKDLDNKDYASESIDRWLSDKLLELALNENQTFRIENGVVYLPNNKFYSN